MRSIFTISLALAASFSVLPSMAATPKLKSVQAFELCMQEYSNETCFSGLEDFLKKQPSKNFEIGQLVAKNSHASKALPFFARAIGKNTGAALCSDSSVQSALDSGLSLPSDEGNAKVARQLFENACYASTLEAVSKALNSGEANRYLKENTCPILLRKGAEVPSCAAN